MGIPLSFLLLLQTGSVQLYVVCVRFWCSQSGSPGKGSVFWRENVLGEVAYEVAGGSVAADHEHLPVASLGLPHAEFCAVLPYHLGEVTCSHGDKTTDAFMFEQQKCIFELPRPRHH